MRLPMPARLTRAAVEPSVAQDVVEKMMGAEGLAPMRWSNGPGDTYAPHAHAYHKVLYCLRGSIRFMLTQEGTSVELAAGDRLDLPPGTLHGAVVGPHGVVCLEGHQAHPGPALA